MDSLSRKITTLVSFLTELVVYSVFVLSFFFVIFFCYLTLPGQLAERILSDNIKITGTEKAE